MKRKMLLFTLALPFILNQNIQAQTSSRLVAEATWNSDGVSFYPTDSSAFAYTGGRGGDLTHTMKYDASNTFQYFTSDSSYHNGWYYLQTFDGNNNILTSISQYWDGTSWVFNTKTLNTYNSSNQLTNSIEQTWGGSSWVPVSQDIYSYNSAGKLFLDQYGTWNSLTLVFDAVSQKTYYYDGSNNKTNETDQAFVSGSPVYTNEWTYTYSSTNQLLTNTYNTWSGSAWAPSTMTTNTYDSTGDLTNALYQVYNAGTATWVNSTMHLYSAFTSSMMLPTMDVLQTWNNSTMAWDNTMMYMYTYNSNNQLTTSVGQSWNVVGIFEFASGDPMSRYYYESYTPGSATAVSTAAINANDANIYPVPARNMLHVDIKWADAQSANIAIYDVQGRIVRQWDAPSGTQYNSAVSVNGLAAGTYFVKINGEKNQIVKQFVVAH